MNTAGNPLRACLCKSAVHFWGFFREGVFAEIFAISVSLGFSPQSVVSIGVMLLGCKPIAKFLAGRSPSTDPPCQKDQEPFSLAVSGGMCVRTAAHIRQSICCTNFRRKHFRTFQRISAKFPQNVRNLHWRSKNDFREFSAKISARFPQLLEVRFAVRGAVIPQ